MGLFEKKFCDICGKELGILGKVKLQDGYLCGTCSGKMSPFVTGKKKMTVDDVIKHLQYREQNKTALEKFVPSKTFGADTKVYVEESTGRFVISKDSNWRAKNPDVLTRTMLKAVDIEVKEHSEEIRRELADGKYESYDPKRYKYEYEFLAHLYVNSPWFDEIRFEVSDDDDRPASNTSQEYLACQIAGQELQHLLMPNKYPAPDTTGIIGNGTTITIIQTGGGAGTAAGNGEAWTCSCGKINYGNFCASCGKPRPVNTRWFCPNCGAENYGNFCSNCGTKRP